MANWDFNQQCGSNTPFEVLITDIETGDPVDLTNASAEWIFAKRDNQGNPTIAIPSLHYQTGDGGKLTCGSDGIIRGNLLPADTLNVAVGQPEKVGHQMYLTLPGNQAMLVQQGVVTFIPKLPTA